MPVFGIVMAGLVIVVTLVQLGLVLGGQPVTRSRVILLCVALISSNVSLIGWILSTLGR